MILVSIRNCGHGLRDRSYHYPTKIILMGDPAQLPPVGESASESFQVSTRIMLTEVVRQANGNPLLGLVERARECAATSREVEINQIYVYSR